MVAKDVSSLPWRARGEKSTHIRSDAAFAPSSFQNSRTSPERAGMHARAVLDEAHQRQVLWMCILVGFARLWKACWSRRKERKTCVWDWIRSTAAADARGLYHQCSRWGFFHTHQGSSVWCIAAWAAVHVALRQRDIFLLLVGVDICIAKGTLWRRVAARRCRGFRALCHRGVWRGFCHGACGGLMCGVMRGLQSGVMSGQRSGLRSGLTVDRYSIGLELSCFIVDNNKI